MALFIARLSDLLKKSLTLFGSNSKGKLIGFESNFIASTYNKTPPGWRGNYLSFFLKTNPSNPCLTTQQILFYFAKLHEDNHKYSSSLDVYLKLLKIVPENPMIYKDVIRIFNKMGKQDLAKEALMSAKRTEFYKTDRCFKMIIDEI